MGINLYHTYLVQTEIGQVTKTTVTDRVSKNNPIVAHCKDIFKLQSFGFWITYSIPS